MSILVVDPAADVYADRLAPTFPQATIHAAKSFADAEPHFGQVEAVVTMGIPLHGLQLTSQIVARMPRLAWVQSLLSGAELVEGALQGHDVVLTSARGIHGPQMTETALLHMLVLGRGVRRLVRSQDARRWEPLPPVTLAGKTVALVGLGSIGRTMAPVFAALGMRVVGVSRSSGPVACVERIFPRTGLANAAAEADFVVLVVPGGPETDRLVDENVLRAMKPDAYLVNLARGSVVDEEALVHALRDGVIAGAGLDVFATEPLPVESPLWKLENVFVTPHLGGRSDRYVEQALAVVEPNVGAFLDGRLDDLVNVVRR